MQRFATLGAVAALLLGGAVVMAASPAPSSSPAPASKPSPTSNPGATPAPSTSPGTTSSAPSTQEAVVNPLQITGSATLTKLAGGGGTMTIQATGLLDAQRWSVDIDGGTIARPNEAHEVAFKSGTDVTRLAMDTISIHLTKAEMVRFARYQAATGVVVQVFDGSREGFAAFAKS
jgi:hypothetical protein